MAEHEKKISLIDPMNGGNLILSEDGTYKSETTGLSFTYNDEKNCFIPNYIPEDDLFELAHIEGDYLVGNVTGSKYKIDEKGNILTPKNIEFLDKQQKSILELEKKYQLLIQKINQSAIRDVEKINQDSKVAVWKEERNIKSIDYCSTDELETFLKKLIDIDETSKFPLLYEFKFDDNKCFYCLFEIIPSEIKKIQSLFNDNSIQAGIFQDNDAFKRDFLEPFIFYQVKEDKNVELLMKDNNNSNICDLYLKNNQGNIAMFRGIDKLYAKKIEDLIYSYLDLGNRNVVKK